MWSFGCAGEVEIEHHETAVYLNIYDITWANAVLGAVGWGAYHTGVEVYGREMGFGRSTDELGVYRIQPKSFEGHTFKKSLYLGRTKRSSEEVDRIVATMCYETWGSAKYHLIHQNCNDFSEALCRELLPHAPNAFPLWVNRPCRMSSFLLPVALTEKINEIDRDFFAQACQVEVETETEEEEVEEGKEVKERLTTSPQTMT